MSELQRMIDEANRRASKGVQKAYAKKSYVKATELQLIDLLMNELHAMHAAYYKQEGDLSQVMRESMATVTLVRRRVGEIAKQGMSRG